MTREVIDEFLKNNEKIDEKIRKIAENYRLSDFVKVDSSCKEYFINHEKSDISGLYGCIYDERAEYLWIEADSVQQRLTNQYMELLHNILIENEIDKVYYIVAYHYLTLCKQWGYCLTEANRAPFPFLGDEISPLAEKTYKEYEKMYDSRLYDLIPKLSVDDLVYYNKIYRECDYHHHATKHFSLIDYMVGSGNAVDKYEFNSVFEQRMDIFVFKYKAIYTPEQLSVYMSREKKEKIKSSLVDVI